MRVVAFGEVMGRVASPGFQRWMQALPGQVEITFAGAEANVAASIALWGGDACLVTALPRNPIADACVKTLRGLGIDTSAIVRTSTGRLGLYFLETGANQRGGSVVYDREGSALMQTPASDYAWGKILARADWFHVTGITPALSRNAADATAAAVRAAKDAGVPVSCDLNFRKKLWNWEPGTPPQELARRTMEAILPLTDLVFANEEDAELVLGIRAQGADVSSGRIEAEAYASVARQITQAFPNVRRVAITLRQSISASHNNWGGLLYDAAAEKHWLAPVNAEGRYEPYAIRNIVDRVGAGDAFAAGLIFALNTPELADAHTALSFAVAASCLKHSVPGDFNYVTRAEVEALAGGIQSGRVSR
ncbi:MAG: PfkB family carbohydrate kinase [Chthonomonadales bacterium]